MERVLATNVVGVLARAGDEPPVLAPSDCAAERGTHGHCPNYQLRQAAILAG
jgi:hypothetical protein